MELSFNDATGTAVAHNNDLRDWAGQDPIKGPGAGNYLQARDNLLFGCHLTSGAHIDGIDFRLAGEAPTRAEQGTRVPDGKPRGAKPGGGKRRRR